MKVWLSDSRRNSFFAGDAQMVPGFVYGADRFGGVNHETRWVRFHSFPGASEFVGNNPSTYAFNNGKNSVNSSLNKS